MQLLDNSDNSELNPCQLQDTKTIKLLTFKSALTILNKMHFGANVTRSGRSRGTKQIWWTSLKGDNFSRSFLRETSWETIIEYAQRQTPVWDRAWLFEVGDVIEFEWFYKTRIQGTVVRQGDCIRDYTIQSSAFKMTGVSDKRILTNYDLKFHKKAVKIGDCPNLNPKDPNVKFLEA